MAQRRPLSAVNINSLDGKNSTEPEKNSKKHVFLFIWGRLTKNTEKHFTI